MMLYGLKVLTAEEGKTLGSTEETLDYIFLKKNFHWEPKLNLWVETVDYWTSSGKRKDNYFRKQVALERRRKHV